MKVSELLEEITRCTKEYPDFLEWDVYTEQLTEIDKKSKRRPNSGQKIKTDGEGWEYFECGFRNHCLSTRMPIEKIFTINVNF